MADGFRIDISQKNKWFMTKKKEIICFEYATLDESTNHYTVYGREIKSLKNFFDFPFSSAILHIYSSDGALHRIRSYEIDEIMLKMVGVFHKNNYIFIPLNHTLDMFF